MKNEKYERYAAIRNSKGLKDFDVAKVADLNPAMFSHWKSNAYTPKVDKLEKIASVLGIGIEELL